jgi:hypothetical protein
MRGEDSEERSTFVVHLRKSRRRAKAAASAELCAVLRGLDPEPAPGGPLAEVAGIIWVTVPSAHAGQAGARLTGLGYIEAVDLAARASDTTEDGPIVRWRKRDFVLVRVYQERDASFRESAPDRRSFLLECGDGELRRIQGYRGGRGPREHRALAVVDARMLVNLVASSGRGRLLDPFAGAGGVAVEAMRRGWQTTTADIDASLRFGLAELSSMHVVADATALPIVDSSVDAVATEPPYDPEALDDVVASLSEMARVLFPTGEVAMLASANQADSLRAATDSAGLLLELDASIDRKGSDVVCLRWRKPTVGQAMESNVGV